MRTDKMTREAFIRKWLGNKDYQYTEENRDLMREDLDKVIDYHALRQPVVSKSFCRCKEGKQGRTVDEDGNQICDVCGGS